MEDHLGSEAIKRHVEWRKIMKRKFIVTGTQVFGPANEKSDIDIVMFYYDAERLREQLQDKGIEVYQTNIQIKHDYPGFYFDLGIVTINIICAVNDVEMSRWNHATEKMLEKNPVADRDARLALFQKFFHEVDLIEELKRTVKFSRMTARKYQRKK